MAAFAHQRSFSAAASRSPALFAARSPARGLGLGLAAAGQKQPARRAFSLWPSGGILIPAAKTVAPADALGAPAAATAANESAPTAAAAAASDATASSSANAAANAAPEPAAAAVVNATEPASAAASAAAANAAPVADASVAAVSDAAASAVPEGTSLGEALISEPVLTAITQWGDLKLLGLANSNPVGWTQSLTELIFVYTGLPWWATIVVATIAIRLLLLPLTLKAQRATTKLANLRPITDPIQQEMVRLRGQGDKMGSQAAAKKMFDIYAANKVSPFSAIWGLAQAPVFICFFMGIRGMAQHPVPGFETGGFGWVTDLTVSDPTYILPILSTIGMLIAMEAGAAAGAAAGGQTQTTKNIIRAVAILTTPLLAGMPAAVFMYIIASTYMTLPQIYLLNLPAVRKLLNLETVQHTLPPKAGGITAVRPISVTEAAKAVRLVKKDLSSPVLNVASSRSASSTPNN
ncbi:60Kd inner membrane protein-domain-containing protein [Entophlyctis helioformis]|nr:60Kd inner membrane protein-domain-containing protein [Entophlyctis helioformis]